jgi:membrane protein required for colicin V production
MDNLPVNITDIAVIIVLLISAFLAYVRGLVHEVLSVAGWVGGGLITIYAFPFAQPHARNLISIELAADLAAGIAVFVISLAILSILTSAISKRVQNSTLNALDRSLGFLFGLARGGILICLLYMAIKWMMPIVDQPAWLRSARTVPLIETGAQQLRAWIPEEAAAKADTAAAETNKLIESQKVIEGLIAPEPKSGEMGTLEGYGRKIRNEMERLIDSSSQR